MKVEKIIERLEEDFEYLHIGIRISIAIYFLRTSELGIPGTGALLYKTAYIFLAGSFLGDSIKEIIRKLRE